MIVLVVEDDAELRGTLARAFRVEGWTVWRAASLEEARMLLDGAVPDVILTDRRLPDGDGAVLVGAAPVVIYSGDGSPVAGAVVVEKPVAGGMRALVRIVGAAVDRDFEGAVASW